MKYVIDTNSLINNPQIMQGKEIVLTSLALREIEKLELKKGDKALQYNIRVAKRAVNNKLGDDTIEIVDADDIGVLDGYSEDYVDNKLIKFAIQEEYGIITDDILLKYKAMSMGIEVIESSGIDGYDIGYEGVRNLYYDSNKEDHQDLMEQIQVSVSNELDIKINPLEMQRNEYLIIWDVNTPTYKTNEDGDKEPTGGYKEIGTYRFDGKKIVRTKGKELHGHAGRIKPLNTRQRLAFDLLQNEEITIKALFGVYGSGKDYMMLSHAIELIKDGKFDKLIWVRNNIEVKDTNSIGFLPDSLESKLKPFLAPLQDFLGGEEGLTMFMEDGKVEVQHLGFIRGRDIKNSIVYVTECQSNTKEHIQLLLGRVGEGSQIWFNGDDQQTDGRAFEVNNGVKALSKLAGEKLYGQVTMDMTERSETARLSGLLDD